MDTAKQARQVLSVAEQKLRELVGVAAAAGDYASAEQLMAWARTVGELAQEPTSTDVLTAAPASSPPPSAARRPRRTPAKGEYPRFVRRGDYLVKIGWSKTDRKEYEHKAPRRVIDALADAIARRSNKGKIFTAEDVFPLRDPQDGSDIPGYQAYVALAW